MNSDDAPIRPAATSAPIGTREGNAIAQPQPIGPGRDPRLGQAETRIQEANIRTDQANTRTDQANSRTEEANTRTDEANTRTEDARTLTDQADLRVCEAQIRTEQAENREAALRVSEERYRRLFEAARDGILILDADTGRITDANSFLIELLGFSHQEMVGKTVGELSPFRDIELNQVMLERLQTEGHVRYENLPLATRDGRHIAVEFVCNVYPAGANQVIQCNIRDITARKQAEDLLHASFKEIAELKAALDEHAIMAITDPQGKITAVNDKFCAISQYSRAELLGQDHRLINSGFHPKAFIRDLWTTIAQGQVWKGDIRNRAKDGTFYWVDTTIVPFLNADGKPRQYVAIRADITERKAAEAAVRESEERFRTMANSIPLLAWIARADGFITWYNERWYQYTGTTPEQMEGWGWQNVQDPELLPKVMANWKGAIAAGQPFEMEFPLRGADGQFRAFLTRSHPMKDSAGRVVQWFGTNTDVEVLKRADVAIRTSEERFRFLNDLTEATRTLSDPAPIMAVMARMLGQHLRASRCAYADVENGGERFTIRHDYTDGCASTVGQYQLSHFGARAVATLGSGQTLIIRNVGAELLPGEGADKFQAIGIQATIICPLVKEGGLRAMMAVHQTTPRDWQPGEIAIVQDVVERCWATIERRNAEEKIHRLNSELEHRVVERTAQLQAANEELESFSYSVSHDLRAPLRHVLGFVELLQTEAGPALSGKSHQHLTTISQATQRMGTLIDDLLAFARIGKSALGKTEVNLDELVAETVAGFAGVTQGRNVVWAIHRLPTVWADRALLKLALVNLISNAVKFTSQRAEAHIEIAEIKVATAAANDGHPPATVICIRDDGAGFDADYADKLFGVFQRLHRQDEFAGTGIGLANVQRIIHRHGGRVWAEGVVNSGASFYFSLPKAKAS